MEFPLAMMMAGCALFTGDGHAAFDAVPPESTIAQPEWLVTEMRRLVAGGDRWITDNSAYRSDAEPWEQYGLEWTRADDGRGVAGRLFGLVDGEDRATFWEMRLWWDEDAQEARLRQGSGDGTVGVGTMKPTGRGIEIEAIQTFTTPDGSTSTIRHVSTTTEDRHVTQSFDFVDGEWSPRRQYVWERRRPGS